MIDSYNCQLTVATVTMTVATVTMTVATVTMTVATVIVTVATVGLENKFKFKNVIFLLQITPVC